MIKKPLFKKIRKKLSMMNFHLKISSRFNVFSFLLALNFVFFSNFCYGNESSGCTDEKRKSVESEVDEIYGVEWINKFKAFPVYEDKREFSNLYRKARDSCVEKICNQLYGKGNEGKTSCQSLPGTPDKLDEEEMTLEFNKEEIEKNITAKLKCSNEGEALKKIIEYAKNKNTESKDESIKNSIPEILKNNYIPGCEKSICELISTNKPAVKCGESDIYQAFLKKFEPEQKKPELKNERDVIDGKNLTSCKWANKLPRRVTTGCGVCVGYVICDAESNQPGVNIQTMRLATCSKVKCGNGQAQDCVEDLSVGSRKPENFDQDNVIQDKEIIKANSSQQ